jgi:hypothetical protein
MDGLEMVFALKYFYIKKNKMNCWIVEASYIKCERVTASTEIKVDYEIFMIFYCIQIEQPGILLLENKETVFTHILFRIIKLDLYGFNVCLLSVSVFSAFGVSFPARSIGIQKYICKALVA